MLFGMVFSEMFKNITGKNTGGPENQTAIILWETSFCRLMLLI